MSWFYLCVFEKTVPSLYARYFPSSLISSRIGLIILPMITLAEAYIQFLLSTTKSYAAISL